MAEFDGKVAVVTGAGKGIGRASALAFAREGAAVVVVDVDEDAAQTTAARIRSAGGLARAVHADVATREGAQRIAATAEHAYGRVDVLHNNAGIQRYGTVIDTSEETWDEVLAINLTSVFLVSKYVVPLIHGSGGGAVVNTASVQSLVSQARVAAYAASKAGLLGLTRSMAVDLAPRIRVNAVLPGTVDTPMLAGAANLDPNPASVYDTCAAMHLLKRIAQPEEIAEVVLFLASSRASFVTGAAYPVDGGLLTVVGGAPKADSS